MRKTLLLSFLIFLLCSCNNNENNRNPIEIKEHSTETTTSSTEKKELDTSYEANNDILNCNLFEQKFQIGKKVVEFPASYQEIMDTESINIDTNYSEKFLVEPSAQVEVTMSLENEEYVITFVNIEEERIALEDCLGIKINFGLNENIFTPKGIKIGTFLEELENILGGPSEIISNRINPTEGNFTYAYYEKPLNLKRFTDEELYIRPIVNSSGIYSITKNDIYFEIDRNNQTIVNIYSTIDNLTYNPNSYSDSDLAKFNSMFDFVVHDKNNNCSYLIANSYKLKMPYGIKSIKNFPTYSVLLDNDEFLEISTKNTHMISDNEVGLSNEELIESVSLSDNEKIKVIYNDGARYAITTYSEESAIIEAEMLLKVDEYYRLTFNFYLFPFDENNKLDADSMLNIENIMYNIVTSATNINDDNEENN